MYGMRQYMIYKGENRLKLINVLLQYEEEI